MRVVDGIGAIGVNDENAKLILERFRPPGPGSPSPSDDVPEFAPHDDRRVCERSRNDPEPPNGPWVGCSSVVSSALLLLGTRTMVRREELVRGDASYTNVSTRGSDRYGLAWDLPLCSVSPTDRPPPLTHAETTSDGVGAGPAGSVGAAVTLWDA